MNAIRPWRTIERRECRQIMVGNVPVGGDAPITVQTMTNTPTEDAGATIDRQFWLINWVVSLTRWLPRLNSIKKEKASQTL